MAVTTVRDNEIYHEIHGNGPPVLLLHGGFCSLEMMRPQIDALSGAYTVYAPERPGHGRSPDVVGEYSYDVSVADTLGYLDSVGVDAVNVVGFSDGAIIGLLIALKHPSRIRSLVAISGNLDPTGFAHDDASERSEPPVDRTREFYDLLSPDGPEHADVVVDKLLRLWTTEPSIRAEQLATVSVPTLVVAGDRDVIRLDHSALIADSIPGGRLCIVPDAGHDLLETRSEFMTFVVREFLDGRDRVSGRA